MSWKSVQEVTIWKPIKQEWSVGYVYLTADQEYWVEYLSCAGFIRGSWVKRLNFTG